MGYTMGVHGRAFHAAGYSMVHTMEYHGVYHTIVDDFSEGVPDHDRASHGLSL